jgi:hypothetical protein
VTWSSNRRLASWNAPLVIGIYPINVSQEPAVTKWTSALSDADFEPIAEFLAAEALRHGRSIRDLVTVRVMSPISEQPPARPTDSEILQTAYWSLRLRWWALQVKRSNGLPATDIELYVRFHRPTERPDLDSSVGLREGHLGIIETEAGPRAAEWTQLAVVHELMHTLGAVDSYGADGLPLEPAGLGEPDRRPLYPQRKCEVMAGQIATSPSSAEPAQSLSECRIGDWTAHDIGWK